MKKIISLVLVLAMVLSCSALVLVGCDVEKDGKVHIFYYEYSDTYLSTVRTALQEDLGTYGYEYAEYNGASDQTTQLESFNTVLTLNPSVVVMNIVDTTATATIQYMIDECEAIGTPIIFFNREVGDDEVNSYEYCAFVGTSTTEAGIMQGEMIAELLLGNDGADYDTYDLNGDGYISYLMLKGQEGNAEAEGRTTYSVSVSNAALTAANELGLVYYDGKTAGDTNYSVDKNSAWSTEEGKSITETLLATYSESNDNMIELVIANNDGMALGAVAALQDFGYNTGKTGSTTIPVFGVDATDAAVEAIASGYMTGTVKQSATGMAEAVSFLIDNAMKGVDLMTSVSTGLDVEVDTTADKLRVAYEKYNG